jgi:transcriptional regulator with XRE-family HTH domain
MYNKSILEGIIMRFGDYLKNLRAENNISQKELADKSGFSAAEISRIETGDRQKVSPNILKAIYPHLGVSYETLLSRAGYLDVDSLNYEKLLAQETEQKKEIEDSTENILSLLASHLFLNKWSVERIDALNNELRDPRQPILLAESPHRNLSDIVARKGSEEWHITVKDYQIDQKQSPKWSQAETEIVYSVIFIAYGMLATYAYSPITKFSIATSNIDYYSILKQMPPAHLNVEVSILLTDLDKNKIIEEYVFE